MNWCDLKPGDVITSTASELVWVVLPGDRHSNLHMNLRTGKVTRKHRLRRQLPSWFTVWRGDVEILTGEVTKDEKAEEA